MHTHWRLIIPWVWGKSLEVQATDKSSSAMHKSLCCAFSKTFEMVSHLFTFLPNELWCSSSTALGISNPNCLLLLIGVSFYHLCYLHFHCASHHASFFPLLLSVIFCLLLFCALPLSPENSWLLGLFLCLTVLLLSLFHCLIVGLVPLPQFFFCLFFTAW